MNYYMGKPCSRKILLTIALLIILGVSGLALYISTFGPPLPANTDEIISQVMASELPEIFSGKTGYAPSGAIQIWYESIEPETPAQGTVLLLAGISSDSVACPPPSFLTRWPPLAIKSFATTIVEQACPIGLKSGKDTIRKPLHSSKRPSSLRVLVTRHFQQ